MSAIYGRLELGGRVIPQGDVEIPVSGLSQWGPDSCDVSVKESLLLIQSTLYVASHAQFAKIIETSSGHLVAADAILDNREDLAQMLGMSSATMKSISDTAIIAAAWERWGPDCLQFLVGDFAFSVANLKTKALFLARDHIGSRPLYWAKRGSTLLWCTAADVLVNHQEWSWPISEDAVTAFQADCRSPLPKTFYKHLERVKPGHYIVIDDGDAKTTKWWKPGTNGQLKLATRQAYTQACRALVERAVADRCNTVQQIGAHLSGGIDSTGVATLAARHLAKFGRKIVGGYAWSPAYSDQFPNMGLKDERRRIEATGAKEGIPVRFGSTTGQDLFEFFMRPMETEGIADLADELPILANAAADNARIILSGWGGDEAFSSHGIGYIGHLLMNLRLSEALNRIRISTQSLKKFRQVLRVLWWDGLHLLLPRTLYNLFNQYNDKDYNFAFMRSDHKRQHHKVIRERRNAPKFGSRPAENIKQLIDFGHIGMRMETWAVWSAQFGLQYRYPLTDRRLLEFLMSIPSDELYPDGKSRGLALAALADAIPIDVTKHDAANEAQRANARLSAWQSIASKTQAGMLDGDCPWFEMEAFRAAALNPVDQSGAYGVLRFTELMTAMRLWFMWLRNKDGLEKL